MTDETRPEGEEPGTAATVTEQVPETHADDTDEAEEAVFFRRPSVRC